MDKLVIAFIAVGIMYLLTVGFEYLYNRGLYLLRFKKRYGFSIAWERSKRYAKRGGNI